MKKLGKVILWVIAIFVALEIVGALVMYASRRVRSNTVLVLRIEGDVPEQPPRGALSQLVSGPVMTVTEIVEALDRARTDPRITGLEMQVSESTLNMAKLQEIRDQIRQFNRAGKFSVAYLEFATNRGYYLASACQTVIMLPKSLLYVRGMMASTTFYRGTLEKLGIYPDFYHIGDYKNASNVYTEKKYTPAHREATQALLADWYHEYIGGVAEARSLTPELAARTIERGPFTSSEALAVGLVDRLGYSDEVREFVRRKNRGSENRLRLHDYAQRTEQEERTKIAVIYATGEIVPGRGGEDLFGESLLGSDTVVEQFRHAREDDAVKAIILRIDSPGGAVFPSEVIRREVENTRQAKPVVVSMSDVAASGGYWIAMSANRIVAEPGTLTGSIGVYTGKMNLQGLYDKLGISNDYVATSDNATLDYPFKNYTPAQRASVEHYMRDIYKNFTEGVAAGRHMKVEAVDKIGQGRVWTGERAVQLALVDELGGLPTAIRAARKLARIPARQKVSLLQLPPPRSLFDKILDLFGSADVLGGVDEVRSRATPRAWLRTLESLARVPVWALMPDVPQVQ